MFLLRLAFLNIGRNVRRSAITILAVGIGLAALIFLWGFHDGTANGMRDNVIRLFTGYVQIHARDFQETLSVEKILPHKEEVIEKIKKDPGFVAYTERIKCQALVGTSENSHGVLLVAINPETEILVTDIKKHIQKGEFLSVGTGGKRQVMLGDRLAKKTHVDIGDKIVIMTQAIDGTLAGYSYPIKGIYHTGSQQLDELSAMITLDSGRELLGMENNAHEIAIALKNRAAIAPFIKNIKGMIDTKTYEVMAWNEIVPEPEMWVSWYSAIMHVILITVMVVIGVGIMNTILMSVFERTRELGVMMAIGTSPAQVVKLILLETLVLQSCGVVFGIFLGYATVLYFSKVGIWFSDLEQALSQSYVSTVCYPMVEFHHVAESVITLMAITTFIGIYPAWKAGRMEPVKAIYHS